MSAAIIPFPSRARPVSGSDGDILLFPRPMGGPHVCRLLNCVLNASWAARGGDACDLSAVDALLAAVRDPAWDDGDAAGLLDQLGVAVDWLGHAVSDQWARTLADEGSWCVSSGSDAIERAVALAGALDVLGSVAAVLKGRCGPGAPPLDAHAAALGLMSLYEEIE